jgi:hypothetical protein
MTDGIDTLEQMVAKLTADLKEARRRLTVADELACRVFDERDAFEAEVKRQAVALVDDGALHLADEQSVRSMERIIVALNGEIRDAMHDLRASEYVSETRRTELLKSIAENKSLTADLARVTAERDGLLAAASRVVRHWLTWGCNWDAYQDALREAIAACAPPASGEEQP